MDWNEIRRIFINAEIVDNKLIIKSDLAKTLQIIKENYNFEMLKDIVAIDNKESGVELQYHLYNKEDDEDLYVSFISNGEVESVSSIYDSAVADEKEIYDLFGVKFVGNEELKRLYMPENWEGHPLKKDYKEADERLKWND